MKKKKKSDQLKGFYYSLENEKIREYMKLTPEEKLQWLEEINQFTNLALNDRQREFREKLRRGEI
jgi:hypothetical protein